MALKRKVLSILQDVENGTDFAIDKIVQRQFDNLFEDSINSLIIDNIVKVNDLISNSESYNFFQSDIEHIADSVVKIVESINLGQSIIIHKDLSELKRRVYNLKLKLEERIKYRILIYGNSNTIPIAEKLLDGNKSMVINIINTTDIYSNKNRLTDAFYQAINVIRDSLFDYILIMDDKIELLNVMLKNNLIEQEAIINYYNHYLVLADYTSYSYLKKFFLFSKENRNYDGIITGLSYAEKGIDHNVLDHSFFNFAASGQDLYYDFEILKYCLDFQDFRETVKYCIIGLSYYSFEYDLTLSRSSIVTERYLPNLGKCHHYKNINEYKRNTQIVEKIFVNGYVEYIYNIFKNVNDNIYNNHMNQEFDSSVLSFNEVNEQIKLVKTDYNKNYPKTIQENILILNEFIDKLKANKIKPIIVVLPVSKFYAEYTPIDKIELFNSIIKDIIQENNVQFIDCYDNHNFPDSYFHDSSHLNYKGAKEFSKLLNSLIDW